MQRYKFQAMVTLDPPDGSTVPAGQMRRMMLRGQHHQTHVSRFFSALVANNGDGPRGLGDGDLVVTVALTANEPREYFAIGDQFALWLGRDIGHGIVTRRLFV